MARVLSLQSIQSSTIQMGKNLTKIDNQRLYESHVYVEDDDAGARQTVVFWSPELECMKKDDNHMTLFLPQTDECEEFYNTLMSLDSGIVTRSSENWKSWFPKDDLTQEDVQERYVSCIKASSKEEQGRVMNLKVSQHVKCKLQNSDVQTSDYASLFDQKTKRGVGRILIELKRVVFGRGNFKTEYVAHQVLLNEPEAEEPETQRFNNESWIDFE